MCLKSLDCALGDRIVDENLCFSVFDKVNLFYLRLNKLCVYVFKKKNKFKNNKKHTSEILPYVRTRGKAEQNETNEKVCVVIINKKPQITETVFAVFSS